MKISAPACFERNWFNLAKSWLFKNSVLHTHDYDVVYRWTNCRGQWLHIMISKRSLCCYRTCHSLKTPCRRTILFYGYGVKKYNPGLAFTRPELIQPLKFLQPPSGVRGPCSCSDCGNRVAEVKEKESINQLSFLRAVPSLTESASHSFLLGRKSLQQLSFVGEGSGPLAGGDTPEIQMVVTGTP